MKPFVDVTNICFLLQLIGHEIRVSGEGPKKFSTAWVDKRPRSSLNIDVVINKSPIGKGGRSEKISYSQGGPL